MDSFDLGIDLGLLPRAGRQAKPLFAEFVRELAPADLTMPAVRVQTAPPLKKIRDTHHALARVLVTAGSESEASAITGYSLSRISILKADPQFQELLEFYREGSERVVTDMRERMAGMAGAALQELSDRLDETPEEFTPNLLKEIVKDLADRTGHAPQRGPAPTVQVNVNLTDRMARARERVNERLAAPAPKVIDHE